MAAKKRSMCHGADMCGVRKEWDEALCPICMEHPHNAVLLLCSAHSKGCRPYICDTSYRHSNCLDRFRKLQTEASSSSPDITPSGNPQGSNDVSDSQSTLLFGNDLPEHARVHTRTERDMMPARRSMNSGANNLRHEMENGNLETLMDGAEPLIKVNLKCPLCRGDVLGQTVVEEARDYLNLKPRSCTRESCTFVGNYRELRRHARSIHPRVRPAEVDPSRQRAWRRLEHEREHSDIVSAIRSAIPGAVVVGDYAIEGGERLPIERERASGDAGGGPWWTTFLFVQMLESMQPLAGPRSRSRAWTRHRRSTGGGSSRRYLWGENLLGLQDDIGNDDGNDSFSDGDEMDVFADVSEQDASPVRRQRRRLTQSRSGRDRL